MIQMFVLLFFFSLYPVEHNENVLSVVESTNNRRPSDTIPFILDYVDNCAAFDQSDTDILPTVLRKLHQENLPLYENLVTTLLADIRENHPVARVMPHELQKTVHARELLLARIKAEQKIQLADMKHKHNQLMLEKKNTQNKFYVTTLTSVLATTAAIIEAIIIAKGPDCND